MPTASSFSHDRTKLNYNYKNDIQITHIEEFIINLMALSEQLGEEIATELRKEGVRELRSTWAITLFRMGDKAWRGVDLSEMWLGVCNISYPIKKMVGLDLLSVERDTSDGRSISIRRTEKGKAVAELVGFILQQKGQLFLDKFTVNCRPQYGKEFSESMMVRLAMASERQQSQL